jgi:GINS complex subunit 2
MSAGLTLHNILSSENEFLAEETIVEVVSNFDHPALKFISGKFGPFVSQMVCKIPLWLAITLKKRGKCSFVTPDWMKIEELEKTLANERTQKDLGNLPFHYIEISQLLLVNARDDIESPDKVSLLVQDIESVRMDRIKIGISSLAASVSRGESVVSAKLNNVSAMEMYGIKRFFLTAMDTFTWFLPPPPTLSGEN